MSDGEVKQQPENSSGGDDGAGASVEASRSLHVKEKIQEVLSPKLKGEDLKAVTSRILRVIRAEAYAGPIPHPEHFEAFERTLPGSAERILAMAERHQAHSISTDAWEMAHQDRRLSIESRSILIGQISGIVIAAGLVAGAIVTAILGMPVVAGIFLTTAAVGMVPSLINGWRGKKISPENPIKNDVDAKNGQSSSRSTGRKR